jgi:hypothetical protein
MCQLDKTLQGVRLRHERRFNTSSAPWRSATPKISPSPLPRHQFMPSRLAAVPGSRPAPILAHTSGNARGKGSKFLHFLHCNRHIPTTGPRQQTGAHLDSHIGKCMWERKYISAFPVGHTATPMSPLRGAMFPLRGAIPHYGWGRPYRHGPQPLPAAGAACGRVSRWCCRHAKWRTS